MSPEDLKGLPTAQLAEVARHAMSELALRDSRESFTELLSMTGHAGTCVAQSARSLAVAGSWSQVADLSGTTKQAAWSKWSRPTS
ncbi:hypothetical protein V3G39_01035 [Dermatophilaceae bacterium Sec6.4]